MILFGIQSFREISAGSFLGPNLFWVFNCNEVDPISTKNGKNPVLSLTSSGDFGVILTYPIRVAQEGARASARDSVSTYV